MNKKGFCLAKSLIVFLLIMSTSFFMPSAALSVDLDNDFDKIAQEIDAMPSLSLPEKIQILIHFLGIKTLDVGSYLYQTAALTINHVNEYKAVYGGLTGGLLALAYYLNALKERQKQQEEKNRKETSSHEAE